MHNTYHPPIDNPHVNDFGGKRAVPASTLFDQSSKRTEHLFKVHCVYRITPMGSTGKEYITYAPVKGGRYLLSASTLLPVF